MQKEQENFYLNEDFESLENELEILSKEQVLRIEINEGLEIALQDLQNLKDKIPQEQTQGLFEQCTKSAMDAVTGHFGFAAVVLGSQDGGNVNTTHNARAGIYASDKERNAYENREKYDSRLYHGETSYKKVNKQQSELKKKGELTDYMTGKKISPNEETALDHIVAAKTVHDDRGRVLAEADGAKLVNTESNLKMTDRRLNSMKQDKSAIEFLGYRDNRQKELERNLAKRGYLTESELNEQKKLDKQMEILDDDFVKTYEKEKKRIDKEIDKAYYISTKPYKEVLLTGAKDSVKMAVYSAFGVVLKDFITAMMQELKITYKEFGNESLKEIFTRFKDRLVAVWEDIKAKWKDIFSGSIEAGLQAFFSNLVVFIINTIFTTLKKLVQIIRAGFTSLWSAVKALCDKDTPKEDRVYAAAQIFVTGMIASVSMLASETIKTWLLAIPGLNAVLSLPIPFTGESIAEALSLCISAAGGAVLSTIALYYMDKLRNQGKIANMQVQMVAQSGVVVEYQVARSYFSVLDGFRFLSFAIEDSMRVIQKTQERINLSNQKAEDSLNDLDGYAKP